MCPYCNRQFEVSSLEVAHSVENNEYRMRNVDCTCGKKISLFEGALKLSESPNYYSVFWPLNGIQIGQEEMTIGEWKTINLPSEFHEIDEINTTCFPVKNIKDFARIRAEAKFNKDKPNEFNIYTSGGKEEWGMAIKVDWVVYGLRSDMNIDVWQENLNFAARQLLTSNYRPSVIQSAISVESFVYHFVTEYLRNETGWSPKNIKKYVDGSSNESLPVQGIVRIFVQEMMGIEISKDVFENWIRLKNLRDALAHGDLKRYANLKYPNGNQFISDKERAEYSYQSAIRFIYEILFPASTKNRDPLL
jgi:hypothetical protein